MEYRFPRELSRRHSPEITDLFLNVYMSREGQDQKAPHEPAADSSIAYELTPSPPVRITLRGATGCSPARMIMSFTCSRAMY